MSLIQWLAHSKEANDIIQLKDGQQESKRREFLWEEGLKKKARDIGERILHS